MLTYAITYADVRGAEQAGHDASDSHRLPDQLLPASWQHVALDWRRAGTQSTCFTTTNAGTQCTCVTTTNRTNTDTPASCSATRLYRCPLPFAQHRHRRPRLPSTRLSSRRPLRQQRRRRRPQLPNPQPSPLRLPSQEASLPVSLAEAEPLLRPLRPLPQSPLRRRR